MIDTLVFSVTRDCPISCKYCVTRSGPNNGPYLNAGFMKEAIESVDSLFPLELVVFTGGEPLLKKRDVEEAVKFAKARKIWTRVVTNAFWAGTPDKANEVIASLKEAGLGEINFSCDDLHQEHIPLENIRNAFWAAKRVELPILIAHKYIVNSRITPKHLSKFLGVRLKEFKEGKRSGSCHDLYCSSLTVPVGNGVEDLDETGYILYPSSAKAWAAPCSSVLSEIVISPEKELRICCGMIEQDVPEINAGKWDSSRLSELIYNANTDLIANWLALEGPYGLKEFIQGKDPSIKFKDHYVNHCHLCNDILARPETRAVLARFAEEKSGDLTLRRGMLEAIRYKQKRGTVPFSNCRNILL